MKMNLLKKNSMQKSPRPIGQYLSLKEIRNKYGIGITI
jgi:hypothetical protein